MYVRIVHLVEVISLIRKHLHTRNHDILSNTHRRNHDTQTGINKIIC